MHFDTFFCIRGGKNPTCAFLVGRRHVEGQPAVTIVSASSACTQVKGRLYVENAVRAADRREKEKFGRRAVRRRCREHKKK